MKIAAINEDIEVAQTLEYQTMERTFTYRYTCIQTRTHMQSIKLLFQYGGGPALFVKDG